MFIIWLILFLTISSTLSCIAECSKLCDKPLILTPYLENNDTKGARRAGKVKSELFQGVESYSGYFTVNKTYNSNLYFWFFPSQIDYNNAPVLVWLQGGPGSSSLLGLLLENGPFRLKQNGFELAEYTWSKTHSVIYIDNPVGTGYSYTEGGYASEQTQVGEELYIFLQQFFTMFPEIRKNDFFVTGESYAGKYVPALSYTIYKKNPSARHKINLKGLAIGNAIIDFKYQINYGDYLYQIGLIDNHQQETYKQMENAIVKFIDEGDYLKAYYEMDRLILKYEPNSNRTLLYNTTGLKGLYNYLYAGLYDFQYVYDVLEQPEVRKAIHVGNLTFNKDSTVQQNLKSDIMQSTAGWLAELLSHYRVLLYNGQLDIVVAYPLTENLLKNLKFSSDKEYKIAKRYKWYVDEELAGYVKQAGNLTHIMVRSASHLVPQDQPKWAFNLINTFTRNEAYH